MQNMVISGAQTGVAHAGCDSAGPCDLTLELLLKVLVNAVLLDAVERQTTHTHPRLNGRQHLCTGALAGFVLEAKSHSFQYRFMI